MEGGMKVGREEGRKTRRKVNRKMRRKANRRARRKVGKREDGKAGRREGGKVEIGREKLERHAVMCPAGRTFKLGLSLNDYFLLDHESYAARSLTLASITPPKTKITPTPLPS